MRRSLTALVILFALSGILSGQNPNKLQGPSRRTHLLNDPADLTREPKYRANRILVRFKPNASAGKMQSVHSALSASAAQESTLVDRLQVVDLAEGVSVDQAIRLYRADASVLYAEPDYIVYTAVQPSDPQFGIQWNLHNTGQSGGVVGADIHATQAWDITTGSSNVVVAVLDTGVDYHHSDLAANIWTASTKFSVILGGSTVNCAPGSHGFNAVAQTCDPLDDNDHGTHVSGIIGAVGNNVVGVAGINWNVQILPCKFLDANGGGSTSNAITCLGLIKQLKDSGINIVATNNSWGGGQFSQALQDAITAQMQDGILFVAAAGNNLSDNDVVPFYPASYPVPNVISVAATTRTDDLVGFSNDGRRTVHIGAPGSEILSTTPNNTYSVFSGTSMAAPHVTGVVALLKAHNPNSDWRTIKNLILAGGDPNAALVDTISQRRLNAFGSLTCSNSSVFSRLTPIPDTISGAVGTPITLSVLDINCAAPAGNVIVQVSPGGQNVTLLDGGVGPDLAAGDGVYTGQFTPSAPGNYTLTFPDASTLNVVVLQSYGFVTTNFNYRTFAGTNLNLGDDSVAQIAPSFPVSFGGATFNTVFVSSNGTVSFTDAFAGYLDWSLNPLGTLNFQIPPTTLVAPFWQDLYPIKGTSQNVFWVVTGSAPNRELVIEWRDVRSFLCRSDSAATVTFEAVFKEGSSDIIFNYSDSQFGDACSLQDFGGKASIGVQVAPGNASSWSFDTARTASGTALLWQSPPPTGPTSPAPVLTSISPTTALWNGPGFTLTVNGSGFVPASLVQWNGVYRATNFVSSTKLLASIPASDIALFSFFSQTNPVNITVKNPVPGGGTSTTLPLAIQNPAPTITSLSPTGATAGGISFMLHVFGTGFTEGQTSVTWNGVSLGGGPLSTTEMLTQVPYSLIASPGTAQIAIHTNTPGGGTSTNLAFTINPSPQAVLPQQIGTQRFDPSSPPPLNQPPPRPMRFLGWDHARKQGPAYIQHFSRSYGPTPPLPTPGPLATVKGVKGPSSLLSSTSAPPPLSMPGFALKPSIPAGFIPTFVATGDFNHDGKMDWVVANGGTNDLWVYLGNGDGTSQLPKIIPLTGSSPVWVAAADLRKNGILDLVVAEADSGTVGVLLGNGDGTFGNETTLFCPGPPLSLAVADFDGDGKPDIVAGIVGDEFTGPFAFFKGTGNGNFGKPVGSTVTPPTGAFAAVTLSAADLNHDGLPDLVILDDGAHPGIYSYLSNGDGSFKEAQFVAASGGFNQYTNAVLGDMNEDGCPDIVAIHLDAGVEIFTGKCDGAFQGFPFVFGTGAGDASAGLAVADMNGDGHLDVITSGIVIGVSPVFGFEAGDLVTVLNGDGKGTLGLARVFRGEPSMFSLALGDLNGDGKLDVVTSNQDTDSASVYLNDGFGGLGGPTGGYIGYTDGGASNAPFKNLIIRDIDGDGKPDISVMEFPQFFGFPWDFTVMLNDGTGKFGPPIRSNSASFNQGVAPVDYVLADFRKTGRPDLLAMQLDINGGSPSFAFSLNAGGGRFSSFQSSIINLPSVNLMNVGDFDKDGQLDLVVAGAPPSGTPGSSAITFFHGNGNGTFQQGASVVFPIGPPAVSPRVMYVGDFNNDGKLDVLLWSYDFIIGTLNHDVYLLLGNGDGTFAAPKRVLQNMGFLAVADLNHDGLPDIVAYEESLLTDANLKSVAVSIYLCQPDGSFQKTQTYQPYAGTFFNYTFPNDYSRQSFSPMVADFNGDGIPDIALFQEFDLYGGGKTYTQILLGNGDGTFTPSFIPVNFDKFFAPFIAADVTGDGRADLMEINGWPASFHVIPAVTGPASSAHLVGNPVVGANGLLRVTLNVTSSSPTTVQLTASDAQIGIATSLIVPAGAISADAPFTFGNGFDAHREFSIQATVGGQTSTAYGIKASSNFALGIRLSPFNLVETIPPGATTPDYQVALISMGGYSTTAQLSCLGLPQGGSCIFGSPQVSVGAGGTGGTSLVIQTGANTPLGSYPIQLKATDGSVSDQITLTLNVADFSVSLSPTTQTIPAGHVANLNLTVGAISGWTDSVKATCTVTPSAGGTCSADGLFFVPGTQQITIQSQSAPGGTYTINLSATDQGVTHQTSATLIVSAGLDYSLNLAPSTQTVPAGTAASYSFTMGSLGGWLDPVNVTCTVAPSNGGTCSANGRTFTPGTQTVTIQSQAAPAGTYTVSLSASGDGVTHQTSATFSIQGVSGTFSSNQATIAVGTSANFNVTLNSLGGTTGQFTFSCLNVPVGVSCGFNPSSGTLPANGTLGSTLTVTVSSRPASVAPPASYPSFPLFPIFLVALALCLLWFAIALRERSSSDSSRIVIRLWASAPLPLVLILGLSLAGCGSHGSTTPPPPPPPLPVTVILGVQAASTSTGNQQIGSITITVP